MPEESAQEARVDALLDRLLDGEPEAVLEAEPDAEVREQVRRLWVDFRKSEALFPETVQFDVVPAFKPGEVLHNRFRIERRLGAGGMGEVYLAHDSLIGEYVALKTIARLLAPSSELRRRFVEEVRSAIRVAHANVCRIHALFEDGDTVFFTMEYIRGDSLAELLDRGVAPAMAREVVLQLARGLNEAHLKGVIHGDFKPANVLIEDGAPMRAVIMDFGLARAMNSAPDSSGSGLSVRHASGEFTAPELAMGGTPTVAADVYAFGRVGQRLMPGDRIWEQCCRRDPAERIPSLDKVIERYGRDTRRYWIGAAGVTLLGVAGLRFYRSERVGVLLPSGARLVVNGFQAAGSETGTRPGLLRSLIIAGVRQSPRIRAIDDQDLLPALRSVQKGAALPASGTLLRSVLAKLRAAFWVDGVVRTSGGRYSLFLNIQSTQDGRQIAEASFRDVGNVLTLARMAALWLRSGESDQSLSANPAGAGQFTSSIPEALEKYFDAMEHWATADMAGAIPLFEEAIRLDPQFAQAYSMLAMGLNSYGRFDRSLETVQKALDLSRNLPERERTWIETNYATIIADPVRMLAAAQKNLTYSPDEPRFYRIMSRSLVRAGSPAEGLRYSAKAFEMAPDDGLLFSEAVINLAEAGKFDQALSLFEANPEKATHTPYSNLGRGFALLGLERYMEAAQAFRDMSPGGTYRFRIASALIAAGELAESRMILLEQMAGRTGEPSVNDQAQYLETLCGLEFLMDRPGDSLVRLKGLLDVPEIPSMIRFLSSAAFWAMRLQQGHVIDTALERARRIEERWPSAHTTARRAHIEGLKAWKDGDRARANQLLVESVSNPISILPLFDLASLLSQSADLALAETYWRRFEEMTGMVVSSMFTGLVMFAAAGRALTAQARGDRATAASSARKILDHWSRNNDQLRIVVTARGVFAWANQL